MEAVKLFLVSLLSFLIYIYQELLHEESLYSFLLAVYVIVVLFTFSGCWNYLTDGKEVQFKSLLSIRNYHLTYALLSVFFAYLIFQNYVSYMFDDSGFTLRYLDNFWDGYFYQYNKSDPPVFGISSFLFGVFTGFWCWTHLLTPEQSIYFAELIGLFCIGFLSLKIIREVVSNNHLVLIFWMLALFSSKMFFNVAASGMETPFHLSFLFAALLFFFQNKAKWMWLFLSLSVISKLDAVPFALVVGLVFLANNRKKIMPITWHNSFIKEILFWVIVPIGLWIVFSFLMFGSPLPQSAYSKIYLQFHPDDHWFPFFKHYLLGDRIAIAFLVFCVLFCVHLAFAFGNSSKHPFKKLVFGFSFFATLVLFYFYNPGEQMMWYYALPDLLLFFQLASSLYFFIEFIPQKAVQKVIAALLIFINIWFMGADVIGGKNWMKAYLETVERERWEMGNYVATRVGENDSIMSNHALAVRHVKGYVIDMTGLNSKFAAANNVDPEQLFKTQHPQWAIGHNSSGYAAFLTANGYTPDRIFYDITNYTYPEWCLYKWQSNHTEKLSFRPLDSIRVKRVKPSYAGGIVLYNTDTLRFELDSSRYIKSIYCGVKREYITFELKIKKMRMDTLIKEEKFEIKPIFDYQMDSKFTQALVIGADSMLNCTHIEISSSLPNRNFSLIEPYILKK